MVCTTPQIRFIAHGVFVKTPLPNTAFVPPLFAGRQVFGMREICGEFGFNVSRRRLLHFVTSTFALDALKVTAAFAPYRIAEDSKSDDNRRFCFTGCR